MMPASSTEPAFNLKVVVQETGLRPDTLRAWERRYGLPQPERTPGGHRLYSQRDIDTLKWLVARQKEGMSISRAVKLWFKLLEEGQDPLAPAQTQEVIVPAAGGNVLQQLRDQWIAASLSFDERAAETIVSQALALYPVETVCLELLMEGLRLIGEGWYRGEITVQQEHFASELATRRLEALLMGSPPPFRPERVLVACPPGEGHTLAPLMLTLFLRRRGWDVVFLGANVPADRIRVTLQTITPRLVVLSAQQLTTAASLLEMGQVVAGADIPLVYGGLIFHRVPDLQKKLPGCYLGDSLNQAVTNLEQWLARPLRPQIAESPPEKSYRRTLEAFRQFRSSIELDTWQALNAQDLPVNHLREATEFLSDHVEAALLLGDLDFLAADVAWVETMLHYRQIPALVLQRHLQIYSQAVRRHMGEPGRLIADWLEECSARSFAAV